MMRDLHLTVCAFLCCAVIAIVYTSGSQTVGQDRPVNRKPISAHGLKCQYCEREEPKTGCLYPKDVCYTHPKGYCMSISVYLSGRLKYRMEGCTKRLTTCMKDKVYRIGIRVSIFCCQYDLCNHWERDRYQPGLD